MRIRDRMRERILLIAAGMVVLLGVGLTYLARLRTVSDVDAQMAAGKVVNLSALPSPEPLESILKLFFTPAESRLVAAKIFAFTSGAENTPRLQTLSQLMQIRIGAADLEKPDGLEAFRRRLGERESVPLITSQQLAQLRPSLVLRSPATFRFTLILYGLSTLIAFWACHALWCFRRFQGDQVLLPILMVLGGVGMCLMISLADPLRDAPWFVEYGQGLIIGCGALYAATHMDYRRLRLRAYGFFFLLALLALSALLILFGSGPGQSEAKVNLWGFQPIEIIKLLLVLYLASYMARRWELLRNLKSRFILGFPVPRRHEALPVLFALLLVMAFLFLQKDLGPAMLFFLLFIMLYAVARATAVEAIAGLALLFFAFMAIYWLPLANLLTGVSHRVSMWISPWDNTAPGGVQLAHSFWALANGGWTGAGLGLGESAMIPAGHTDFVLPVWGEQTGFLGLGCVLILFYLLFRRCLQVAGGAQSPYPFFLSLGLAFLMALQFLIIAGGVFALWPLTGVTVPFLSYGKSSLSVSFLTVGLLLMISAAESGRDEGPDAATLKRPLRAAQRVMAVSFLIVFAKVAYVQAWQSDEYLIAGILSPDADRVRRFHYNPRLERIAASLPRGAIYDRHGIPIASSDWNEIQRFRESYAELGFPVSQYGSPRDSRHYPLNYAFAHITGHAGAPWNPLLAIENEYDGPLKGYDDRARVEMIKDPDGQLQGTIRRDYRDLIPLLRHRYRADHPAVEAFHRRDRRVQLSLDARLQVAAWRVLERGIKQAGKERGALALLAADTGETLALVSYPSFDPRALSSLLQQLKVQREPDPPELLDRARRGLYPPGSTFKVVTAAAALRKDPALRNKVFRCERLPDGRVGFELPRYRTIRDDRTDQQPHGAVAMAEGLAHSCNAYFAQLGVATGEAELYHTAKELFQIYALEKGSKLKQELAQASFGQGSVLVTPFEMARVAAALANDGKMPIGRWVTGKVDHRGEAFTEVLPQEQARSLAAMMRAVVQRGTARAAFAGFHYPVAGKTGTAEVKDKPAHSWFIGFAPARSGAAAEVPESGIAFSVIIENGGYGGRAAAPVARALVDAWWHWQNSR